MTVPASLGLSMVWTGTRQVRSSSHRVEALETLPGPIAGPGGRVAPGSSVEIHVQGVLGRFWCGADRLMSLSRSK